MAAPSVQKIGVQNAAEEDTSSDFSAALAAYLSTLLTVGDCVVAASPQVGAPYRQRLGRLRARVAFQPNAETLKEAATALDSELKEYAEAATRQTARYNSELRREIISFREIIEAISQRQEFYAIRLRQFAAQMEHTRYPTDPEHLADVLDLQAAGLRGCVESMTNETASLVVRMRQEMQALDERLAGTQCLDPVTGLINRQEMLEQIATHQETGAEFSLLLFEVAPPAGNEIMRIAADRMLVQFRHTDRISRWGERQFMVLFRGGPELAESRAKKILPWIEGPYRLGDGEVLEVHVALHALRLEAATA